MMESSFQSTSRVPFKLIFQIPLQNLSYFLEISLFNIIQTLEKNKQLLHIKSNRSNTSNQLDCSFNCYPPSQYIKSCKLLNNLYAFSFSNMQYDFALNSVYMGTAFIFFFTEFYDISYKFLTYSHFLTIQVHRRYPKFLSNLAQILQGFNLSRIRCLNNFNDETSDIAVRSFLIV